METKTASHYKVVAKTPVGWVALDVSESLQEALEYRDLNGLSEAKVLVVFTDGTDKEV